MKTLEFFATPVFFARPLAVLLEAAVIAYQWSPFRGMAHCRFEPSCSHYARRALRTWGATAGLILAIRRLAKCHPWGPFGADDVPARPCIHGGSDHP